MSWSGAALMKSHKGFIHDPIGLFLVQTEHRLESAIPAGPGGRIVTDDNRLLANKLRMKDDLADWRWEQVEHVVIHPRTSPLVLISVKMNYTCAKLDPGSSVI